MATSYRPQVSEAFEVLAEGLAPFVDARMATALGDGGGDWVLEAATKLGKRPDVLVSLADPHFQLEVMSRWWGPAFAPVLAPSARELVQELRTARNHWAHPDPDHPFDVEYALRVHQEVEELLREVGAPEAESTAALAHALRWSSVRDSAAAAGRPEHQVLLDEVVRLEEQQRVLTAQLEQARAEVTTAAGRSRAVARQLAELQTQYAAVAGLRDDYAALQRQLEAERVAHEAEARDTTDLHRRLDRTGEASRRLEGEAEALRLELERTRSRLDHVDPLATEAGRRWIWLMASLIVLLAVLIGLLGAALG
jgi:hypothetical protein